MADPAWVAQPPAPPGAPVDYIHLGGTALIRLPALAKVWRLSEAELRSDCARWQVPIVRVGAHDYLGLWALEEALERAAGHSAISRKERTDRWSQLLRDAVLARIGRPVAARGRTKAVEIPERYTPTPAQGRPVYAAKSRFGGARRNAAMAKYEAKRKARRQAERQAQGEKTAPPPPNKPKPKR